MSKHILLQNETDMKAENMYGKLDDYYYIYVQFLMK